jgi:hypothetical protein
LQLAHVLGVIFLTVFLDAAEAFFRARTSDAPAFCASSEAKRWVLARLRVGVAGDAAGTCVVREECVNITTLYHVSKK